MSPSKIVHFEFMGSWLLFWAFCISGIGLPLAVLYLLNGTVRIEEEVDDAGLFLEKFRARR
jgi:hypothetical protein